MKTPKTGTPNQSPQPDRESLSKQLKDIESRIQDFEREREKILKEEFAPYEQTLMKSRIEAITDVEGILNQVLILFFNICNNLPECKLTDPTTQKKQFVKEIEPRVQGLCKILEQLSIEENLDELKKEHDKVSIDLAEAQQKEAEQPTQLISAEAEIPQSKTPTEAETKAYDSYKWVCENNPDLVSKLKSTQRYSLQMYEYVKDHCPLYRSDEGVRLPAFDSWARYIRAYEQKLCGSKNTPRAGRGQPRGVKPSQLQSLDEVTSKYQRGESDKSD